MSSEHRCPKCQDTKHVLEDGVWVRCTCLLELMSDLKYARAGLTYPSKNLVCSKEDICEQFPDCAVDDNTFNYIKIINTLLKRKGSITKTFCFSGAPTSAKDFIVQCLLKSAIDAGFKVSNFSVDELIQRHFKRENEEDPRESFSMLEEFSRADVFSLYFGSEIQFRIGEAYLTEIIRAHRVNHDKKILLLNTSLTYDGLASKYSDSFRNMFVPYFSGKTDVKHESRAVFITIR